MSEYSLTALALSSAVAFVIILVLSKPKAVALNLISIYKGFCRAILCARGLSPDDVSEQRILSGTSWDEFCDSLKAAGAIVLGSGATDPLTQVCVGAMLDSSYVVVE